MALTSARRALRAFVFTVFAGLTANGEALAAEQTFYNPQMGGAAVDHCETWATNCGQAGADQFCRTQGYTRAIGFSPYNPGRTYVIGSQQICEGGYCVGLSQVTCVSETSSQAGGTFNYPQVGGAAVDHCVTWATNCGKPGADQFCRAQGYAGSDSFQTFNPGRTYVIGSQQVCEGGACVGFSQVVCGAGMPPPPPSAGPLTGTWFGYSNNYYFQQNGNTFTWSAPGLNETAQGTINGTALTVTWTNSGGGGSATGTIVAFDSNGRATKINWSNGVVFDRVQ